VASWPCTEAAARAACRGGLGQLIHLRVVQQAPALQQAHDALGGRFDDLLDVGVL